MYSPHQVLAVGETAHADGLVGMGSTVCPISITIALVTASQTLAVEKAQVSPSFSAVITLNQFSRVVSCVTVESFW